MAERIMSGAIGQREGDVGRIIRRIVSNLVDDATRATHGKIGRPRLVFAAPRRFVVRWPGAMASARDWAGRRLALCTPVWLRAVQWAVVAALLVACGGRVEAEAADLGTVEDRVDVATSAPFYASRSCAALPCGVARGAVRLVVTSERDDWYPDAPMVVRTFDGARPSERREVCRRDRSPTGCTCRSLEDGENAYTEVVP